MRLRRSAAAVLGLLVVLPALAACGGGGSDVKVGDIVDARSDDQFIEGGKASSIALPIGRLEISAGKPTTELTADDTAQLEAVDAPDGSTFVPITWQYDAGTFGDYDDYLESDATPVVDLVADRASYRIPAPEPTGSGADSFYVLVEGDGEDASLSVDFDGVSQSVDLATGKRDAGAAAGLYDLKPRRERTSSCTADSEFDIEIPSRLSDYACSVTRTARLPYAGGQWAEKGESWLAVSVRTTLRRYDQIAADRRSGTVYLASSVDSTFRIGKTKPTEVIEDRTLTACPDQVRGGCVTVYHLIFEAEKDTPSKLRMDQTYQLALSGVWGGAEGKDTVELTNEANIKLR
ncbi:MAG TPA: hypothetical protein VNS46_07695 [Nocardioides sp.]|nr:hypothetical protein [Nocardioides sp.]